MNERERLIELLKSPHKAEQLRASGIRILREENDCPEALIADYLLANGVIVTPCVAMVEQFIKGGEFDKKHTAHNGRFAVVYIDKSKWNCPLIDITEQFYNDEKAKERIQALESGKAEAEKALAERGKQ